ncbi:hypothetical protein [Methanoplanus limicola]|uniref:Uncharacterized protein n=1 Tax=Methanoplanus limicola DSM 2279 TaxID=937775 RepID=H1Z1B2_9EURY|nr:hypothetical protein [Methanoplanus limicola]EHQ35379.1 hypothetical protein Metlim_1270 [Methanoplanus limicola DSM 2279]
MNRRQNNILSPMSYHLFYSLLKLIESGGNTLRFRMNIISEIVTDLEAKKNGLKSEGKEVKDLSARIETLKADFRLLRQGYQPLMENQLYNYGKMGTYESAYDAILAEAKSIIEEFNILDRELIKEIALPGAAHAKMMEEE